MKVLVTGRSGQLVRSLKERVAGRSDVVLVEVGRPELDLAQLEGIAETIRSTSPDLIINAAAYTAVDQAEDEPQLAWRINAEAPAAIAAAARKSRTRIIHISTDYVFDGSSPEPYAETSPTNPLGEYGRSKLAGENAVRSEAPDHLIVRTAWVYSPFGRNFVKTMLSLAQTRDEVTVIADQRGNPSSALDLADGLLHVLDHWSTGEVTGLGQTYHLAGSGAATWYEFAEHVFAIAAEAGLMSAHVRPITTADWPTRALRPANSMLNCGKFLRDFGFAMPHWRRSAAKVVRRLVQSG